VTVSGHHHPQITSTTITTRQHPSPPTTRHINTHTNNTNNHKTNNKKNNNTNTNNTTIYHTLTPIPYPTYPYTYHPHCPTVTPSAPSRTRYHPRPITLHAFPLDQPDAGSWITAHTHPVPGWSGGLDGLL
jgi:hypothetical protein